MSDHLRAHDAALARLQRLHPRKIDLSLGRLERLCAALGHPERRLPPTIHIAGTNGKGSTAAFVRAIAEAAGLRVHVYTSPHLVRFAERIRLAGTLISEDALAGVLAEVEAVNAGEAITFFEISAAAAFLAFSREPADLAILEVGLGGRFDATNVIPCPDVAVIAPVDLDHKEFLGDNLSQIAREKAGILKSGGRAVVARQSDEARTAIEQAALTVGADLSWMGQDFDCHLQAGAVVWQDGARLLDLPLPALAGLHQIDNAGLAIAAVLALEDPRIDVPAIAAGLRTVTWPARLQRLTAGPLAEMARTTRSDLWLDGGHNPHAARMLVDHLAAMRQRDGRPLTVIMGLLATKDADAILVPFRALGARLIMTGFDAAAVHDPESLVALAAGLGLEAQAAGHVAEAMQLATASGSPSSHIVICGSLYLAGEVLALSEDTWPI